MLLLFLFLMLTLDLLYDNAGIALVSYPPDQGAHIVTVGVPAYPAQKFLRLSL